METSKFQIVAQCKITDPQAKEKGAGLLTYPYSVRAFYVEYPDEDTERELRAGVCARLIWMQQYIKKFKSIEDWKALIYTFNPAILPSSIATLYMYLDMDRRLCYIWWDHSVGT